MIPSERGITSLLSFLRRRESIHFFRKQSIKKIGHCEGAFYATAAISYVISTAGRNLSFNLSSPFQGED